MSAKRLGLITGHRHGPFLAALCCAAVVTPLAIELVPRLAIEIGAIAFFATYLVLTRLRMAQLTAAYLKRFAATTDEPTLVIIAVAALAVAVAIVSLFMALNQPQSGGIVELVLAFASVIFGWMTIHTMATIHYAHLYWRPGPDDGGGSAKHRGGLDFPGGIEPCGYDFLYFSFVIGMTAQTSDVAITSTAMRRLNLLHAVVSFFFNTVLVAAAVNAAVALAS